VGGDRLRTGGHDDARRDRGVVAGVGRWLLGARAGIEPEGQIAQVWAAAGHGHHSTERVEPHLPDVVLRRREDG